MSVNAPSLPECLGKYKIISEIGRGGFGSVYRAVDTLMDSPVALKVLASHLLHDPTFVERFRREAHLARTLKHTNIILIYDLFMEQGVQFLVMELVEGTALDKLIGPQTPMPFDRVLRIVAQVASALDYAHKYNVIHRDIKPSNILIGADDHVTLTDFGLAKAVSGSMPTTTGTVGSPAYMSPEQVEGATATASSDLYSLGVVVYEMLTGRVPFMGDTPLAVMRAIADKPVPPPSEVCRDVLPDLDSVMYRALGKNPAERFADGSIFVRALADAASGPARRTEQARLQGEAEAKREAEELARQEALAKAKRESEEQTKHKVKERTKLEAREKAGQVRELHLTLDLVRVPAGEFLMGSDNDPQANSNEKPQHKVYLDEYLIGKYPVMVAQFAEFVRATGFQWNVSLDVVDKGNHPVTLVSWENAVAFCEWASAVTGQQVSLPTEAQWEKAARGTDGRIYPWGNNAPDVSLCNFDMNVKNTTPVGQYSPRGDSPYGCMDMAGNVREWCADWYDENYYRNSPAQNPAGPASDLYRVLRGGSFYSYADNVRCAYRRRNYPDYCYRGLGFRICVLPSTAAR